MKTLVFTLILAVSIISFGQSIDQNVVSTAGDHYKSNSASLSWTLGEVATESFTGNNFTLNQGFQQGNLFVTSIDEELDLGVSIKAYPNPVVDILIISVQELDQQYQVIDMHGVVIKNGIITSENEELDFTDLPSGIYFLKVQGSNTHKIVKK